MIIGMISLMLLVVHPKKKITPLKNPKPSWSESSKPLPMKGCLWLISSVEVA